MLDGEDVNVRNLLKVVYSLNLSIDQVISFRKNNAPLKKCAGKYTRTLFLIGFSSVSLLTGIKKKVSPSFFSNLISVVLIFICLQ